jgi:hypothetical protein
LEEEALPAPLARRLTSGDASAAQVRARYIARSRRAYLSRVGGAAQKRFQAWTPRSGAAAALATLNAAAREHASLRRLAASGDGNKSGGGDASEKDCESAPLAAKALDAAQRELVRTADESLEETLEALSWAMQGHAELDAPAPALVAGVALSLARAAAPAPCQDGGPPEALPPAFPEARALLE